MHRTFLKNWIIIYPGQVLLMAVRWWYIKVIFYYIKDMATKVKPLIRLTATIFRIGSLSKPFTATVILRLVQDGRLSLHDPVSNYIPGYPEGDSITIEQLLIHHSGVKEYLALKAIQELPDSAPPISMEQLISYFKNEPRVINPGEKFPYSNSNYILLACVIEKITGEKFEHVVRKMIFDPLQMHHSGFDFMNLKSTDKSNGHERNKMKIVTVVDFDSTYAPGCGSMFTTVMDLYKWYKGLYSGQVISDSTREHAFVPRQWMYGYGWFRYSLYGKKCISHPGGVPGFVADMKFFPDDGLCIILLNNSSEGKADADKIAAMVFQKRYQRSGL
jgi:CubicO group peptidase (beta-lactamase class C family)